MEIARLKTCIKELEGQNKMLTNSMMTVQSRLDRGLSDILSHCSQLHRQLIQQGVDRTNREARDAQKFNILRKQYHETTASLERQIADAVGNFTKIRADLKERDKMLDKIGDDMIRNFLDQETTDREFEYLIADMFTAMRFDAVVTQKVGDHGKDVIVSHPQHGRGAVECKQYRGSQVKEPVVRSLAGCVSK